MASYTIKKGDTLSKIAKQYGTTVSALASANSIKDPDKIRAGATINIPESAAAPAQPAATPAPTPAAAPAPATPAPATTPTYTVPTEEELRKQAEAIFDPAYQQALDALAAQESTLTTRFGRAKEDYGNYIDRLLKDTQQGIEDSLIKRGMGRSTRAAYEVTEGLANVNRGAQEYLSELEQDYADSLKQLDTQRSTLAATREQNIQSKILDLMQYYESVRQFNEDLALRQRQLELASQGSSRGGGGGGGGSRSALTAEDIYGMTQQPNNAGTNATDAYSSYINDLASKYRMPAASSGSNKVPSNFTGFKGGKYYINGKVVTARQYAMQGA